jgi:hypothetical protein
MEERENRCGAKLPVHGGEQCLIGAVEVGTEGRKCVLGP